MLNGGRGPNPTGLSMGIGIQNSFTLGHPKDGDKYHYKGSGFGGEFVECSRGDR